jgi:hypothetical protein
MSVLGVAQVKGVGLSFQWAAQRSMASSRSATLVKTP